MADLYALEPDPDLPGLPGEAVIREHEDQLLDVLVADVYLHALQCVQRFGDFHLALSPGRFQERLCLRLMTDPQVRELPWKRTHLWAVHDRPDPVWGSTFTAVLDLLEDHSGIPDSNLHAPDLGDADPAGEYERRFQERLAWREKGHDRLDLAVLGLDPAGGVAGMGGEIGSSDRLFVSTGGGAGEGAAGVTMTTRLLNATRLIALAAVGPESTGAVRDAGAEPSVPRPIGGSLRWYLDRAACPE